MVTTKLMTPTRTAATETQYADRARTLLSQACRELGTASVSPSDFASWLLGRKSGLSHATWRLYRSAARWHLARTPGGEMASETLAEDARTGGGRDTLPDDTRERVGSAKKLTYFRHADATKLQVYLRKFSTSEYAAITADWIRAGLVTGLRPVEWGGSRLVLEGGREVLRVQSAKATNGRGTGAWRLLDVSGLASADLEAVRRMTSAGLDWLTEDRFAIMQARASACLRSACGELWPSERCYALYSCRHQAIANFRANMALADVQAIVGHADAASTGGYGHGAAPWSAHVLPPLPRPFRPSGIAVTTAAELAPKLSIPSRHREPWMTRLFAIPKPVSLRPGNTA